MHWRPVAPARSAARVASRCTEQRLQRPARSIRACAASSATAGTACPCRARPRPSTTRRWRRAKAAYRCSWTWCSNWAAERGHRPAPPRSPASAGLLRCRRAECHPTGIHRRWSSGASPPCFRDPARRSLEPAIAANPGRPVRALFLPSFLQWRWIMVRTLPSDVSPRLDASRILAISFAMAVHAMALLVLLLPLTQTPLADVPANPNLHAGPCSHRCRSPRCRRNRCCSRERRHRARRRRPSGNSRRCSNRRSSTRARCRPIRRPTWPARPTSPRRMTDSPCRARSCATRSRHRRPIRATRCASVPRARCCCACWSTSTASRCRWSWTAAAATVRWTARRCARCSSAGASSRPCATASRCRPVARVPIGFSLQ